MIDVEELLLALKVGAKRDGKQWKAPCPNPDHADRNPSWTIVDSPGEKSHGSHHCFSCGFGGGPWELAAAAWGVSPREAGRRLWGLFGSKVPKKVPSVPSVRVLVESERKRFELPAGVEFPGSTGKWYEPARRYLDSRGVTPGQIDKWHIGYSIRGRLINRVVVPVVTEGELRTFSARAITPALRRYETGRTRDGAQPRRAIFGEPQWDRSLGVVTIAEGVWSALALERAGAPNVCALLGSALTPEKARVLSGFRHYLIATDPDPAGDRCKKFLEVVGRGGSVAGLDLCTSPDDEDPERLAEAVSRAF